MTACNVLITDQRAWVAQDDALYRSDHLPPIDTQAKDCDIKPESAGTSPKIHVSPDNRLIVAGAGTLLYYNAWMEVVRQTGGDIDALAAIAQATMQGLLRDHPVPNGELRIVMAGYSKCAGRVTGVLYDWRDAFQPAQLPNGAVIHSPELDGDAPGVDEMQAMLPDAREGRYVPAFFEAMYANQRWQCDQGLLRAGVLLSDSYGLASVDQYGAATIETFVHPVIPCHGAA